MRLYFIKYNSVCQERSGKNRISPFGAADKKAGRRQLLSKCLPPDVLFAGDPEDQNPSKQVRSMISSWPCGLRSVK